MGSDGAGAGCHRAAGVPQSGPIARRLTRSGLALSAQLSTLRAEWINVVSNKSRLYVKKGGHSAPSKMALLIHEHSKVMQH